MAGSAGSPVQADPDELVAYLDEESIRLAVFGEFSAGKTTVLNALIGEEILSVAVEPTTAVPTRVRHGREFNIFVERTDGEQPILFEGDPPFWTRFVGRRDTLSTLQKQQGTIRDFLRTWTKEGKRADEVERVVIELPLDWLKGGLELVDTPGVNNEFARHQGFTEQEAGAADIAVLLMDARQGGGRRTEFEFMNEVQRQVERCVVAPNKMDLVPEGEREEFLGYVRETALPKHWEGAVTPPVLGISALAALHPGEHGEPGLVAAFDDLRGRLERLAEEERGKLLLSRKGNPEKQLFARAKELEGEEHYGRAHRLYFDLLDVLGAAGLDLTPAEEGVARCEEHLSAQVDALDDLNERYNEAMALAEDDPDAALEELTAIRDEKEDLRLKDGDLHASIEQLRSRIEERDEARQQIRRIKRQIEEYRHDGELIGAAKAARKILPLIEAAECSEDEEQELRALIKKQEAKKDEWKERRRSEVKEALDKAEENPDEALKQLREIYGERKILDDSDIDLKENIRALEELILRRDEARKEIRSLKEKAKNYRQGWIVKAAGYAKKIPSHLEEAILPPQKEESLRDFVSEICEKREKWAEARWMELKEQADACLEEKRYMDAEEHLDELETVAPHTPFEEETAAFAEEVHEKAELEAEYRGAVREAVEMADMLREDRVDPDAGAEVEEALKTAIDRYRTVYGVPDLPDRPPVEDSGFPLTIDQKLGLALHLDTLAKRFPNHNEAETLTEYLRERRAEMRGLSLDDWDGLDLVEEYPDHPEAEAALNELLNGRPSFWAPPTQIRRTRVAVNQYRDYLGEKRSAERLRELDRRAGFFEWHDNTIVSAPVSIFGVLVLFLGIFSEGTLPGILVGAGIFAAGIAVQYLGAETDIAEEKRNSGNVYELEMADKKGGLKWKCPKCGSINKSEEMYDIVSCKNCIRKFKY